MSRMSHADVVVVVTAAGSKAARDREAGAKKRRGDPLFCLSQEEVWWSAVGPLKLMRLTAITVIKATP